MKPPKTTWVDQMRARGVKVFAANEEPVSAYPKEYEGMTKKGLVLETYVPIVPKNQLRGVRLLLDNGEEVAQWCGGELTKDDGLAWCLAVPNLEGTLLAYPGDYVMKNQHGRFMVFTEDDMYENYERKLYGYDV